MSDTVTTPVPFNTLVTVRVKGQSKRLSRVTLVPLTEAQAQTAHAKERGITVENTVRVRTGKRGRPAYLPLDKITDVRVLKAD